MAMANANVKGLAHFTIPVRNVARAERFYTEVLGADVVRRSRPDPETSEAGLSVQQKQARILARKGTGRNWIAVKLGDQVFDLFEELLGPWPARDNPHQHPHYAFEVESLEVAMEQLRSRGIPYAYCSFNGPGVGIYFLDPDGHHLEFVKSHGQSKEGIPEGDPDWANMTYEWP
jgi:catechol 2,3-dioxygenase-like lactoylglutathione lyase family enzyme